MASDLVGRFCRARFIGAVLGLAAIAIGFLGPAARAAGPSADLSASVSGPGVGAPGGNISINITGRNNGPDAAKSVILRNHLTNGSTTFVSLSAPAGWSCLTPAVGAPADDVSCTIPGLAAGTGAGFTLVVRIVPSYSGSISESARIASSTGDPNSANDVATTSIQALPAADIAVTVSGPPSAPANTYIEYAITLRNGGPDASGNVTLVDTIPSQTRYSSWRASTFAWSCTHSESQNRLICSGSLGNGGSAVVYLSVFVEATASGTITNRPRAVYGNDPNTANNEASLTLDVTHAQADLAVTGNGLDSVAPGDTPLYSFTMKNNGPDIAYLPQISVAVPAQTMVLSISSSSAWGCANRGDGTWFCGGSELAPGAETTMFVSLHIDAGATGSISVTGTGTSNSTDPDPRDNSNTFVSSVASPADVGVTMTGPATAEPGADITYSVGVTNDGPNTAQQVSVYFEHYPGTFVSISAPSQWECSGEFGETSPVGCNVASLAVDATAAITLVITVDPDAVDLITNEVTVSSLVDSNFSNDSAEVATLIGEIPSDATVPSAPTDLSAARGDRQVTLTWSGPPSDGGAPITGYDVYMGTSAGGEGASPLNATPLPGSATAYTVTGLTNGTTYFFTVKAINGVGHSAASNEVSAIPATVPAAPVALSATGESEQVTLTWSAPASDGGAPLTGYDVYMGTAAGGEAAAPVNATPLAATATGFTVPGLTNGTTYFFTVKAINAVGHSAPSNEASATPSATTAIVYKGTQLVNVGASVTPTATLSSSATACRAGQFVSFSLDANPVTGDAGEYGLGGAVTSSTGQATATPVATGDWMEGVYTVTARFDGTAGCAGSSDSATLTVTYPGTAANGAGWYSLGGSGRVSFGFTVRLISGTVDEYTGSLVVINNGKWRLKASLSNYGKTSDGNGAATGTGDLYWWNPSLNGGLGDWQLAQSGVSFTIGFSSTGKNKRTAPGTFGIRINYTPVAPQTTLPNSAPQNLRSGVVNLA